MNCALGNVFLGLFYTKFLWPELNSWYCQHYWEHKVEPWIIYPKRSSKVLQNVSRNFAGIEEIPFTAQILKNSWVVAISWVFFSTFLRLLLSLRNFTTSDKITLHNSAQGVDKPHEFSNLPIISLKLLHTHGGEQRLLCLFWFTMEGSSVINLQNRTL